MKPNFFVELTLTNNCNCKCEYCFEGEHRCEERNLEEENRQLQLILNSIEVFDKEKYDKFVISFWGGEPFLNTDFMYEIIKKTYKNEFVHYNYYSNGMLTEKYKEFLAQDFINDMKDRIRIQLSYDGLPIHNKKRGNNANNIIDTADLLRANQICFDFKATLPFDCISDLGTVWDSYYWLFLRYGDNVAYSPTLDTNCTDTELIDGNLDEFNKQILDICKKEYVFHQKYGRFLMSTFIGDKRICDIDDSIFLHTDGNAYYCHGCPYKKDNKNLILATTELLHTVFDCKTDVIKTNLEYECRNCIATYCASCHIMQLSSNDDPREKWVSCRKNNKNICKYYKAFGILNRLLNYAITY